MHRARRKRLVLGDEDGHEEAAEEPQTGAGGVDIGGSSKETES